MIKFCLTVGSVRKIDCGFMKLKSLHIDPRKFIKVLERKYKRILRFNYMNLEEQVLSFTS